MSEVKGKQSLRFAKTPFILNSASVVGKKEGEGPLGEYLAEGSSNPGIGKIWAYAGRNPLYFCRRPVGSDYCNILWTSRL